MYDVPGIVKAKLIQGVFKIEQIHRIFSIDIVFIRTCRLGEAGNIIFCIKGQ